MRFRVVRWVLLAALGVAALLVWVFLFGPKHPVALIRVVDAAGKPIVGAVIMPEGLRTKAGPYVSGWYGWRTSPEGPPNPPVSTDTRGYARVPYPKYVFERIETGQLCLSVSHADFVPQRPERIVTTTPPTGAPWRVWVDYVWNRLRARALIARTDPVVLQSGAILKLSVRPNAGGPLNVPLFAQVSAEGSQETNFWLRPAPGVLVTRRLASGKQTARALQFDSEGVVWFSEVVEITPAASQTNELTVELKRGVNVHGRLDGIVPRPVVNGRVVAHVWPRGLKSESNPPQWHAWTQVRPDGSFEFGSLPAGELEIVALCDGFVSTNGPGQFPSMHYPQKWPLGTNNIEITLGMEPTACLEVRVLNDQGNPLKDARVSTWPNVRYGEWSAVVLASDCYNTADYFREDAAASRKWWERNVQEFSGKTDGSGLAVLRNLPLEVHGFNVEHAAFELPSIGGPTGQKRREASVTLTAGKTNRVTVNLEPRGAAPIAHY